MKNLIEGKENVQFKPYSDYERFMCLNEVLETYDQGLSARLGLHANVNCRSFGFLVIKIFNYCFISAQSATHACVFAQMYVNKKCEGVHAFVLQVRPFVTIGLFHSNEDRFIRVGIIGKGVLASGLASTIAIRSTFEGENNMIMQQTSNILLAKMAKGGSMETPMETMKFLEIEPKPFSGKWSERIVEDVLSAYKWMIYRLIKEISTEYKRLKATNNNLFQVKNQTQVHRAHTLSIAFAEHTIIQWCEDFMKEVTEPELKATLSRLSTLYALFALEKHLATLYIGSFCNGPKFGEGVRSSMREVEKALVPDAVALVDAIAPPDFILHSTLGMSDGR
uniref:ACOX domain-containing protein n=1 Tax=Heterorhabditis bacteriophora TaxID=37862 RepID=A0A1I7XJI1_HETBA